MKNKAVSYSFILSCKSILREAFILKKLKNYGKFHNWSDPPPGFGQNYGKQMMYFFWDTRPLFEHFGDFFLFYP